MINQQVEKIARILWNSKKFIAVFHNVKMGDKSFESTA
jgi:hypothetical protein